MNKKRDGPYERKRMMGVPSDKRRGKTQRQDYNERGTLEGYGNSNTELPPCTPKTLPIEDKELGPRTL